MKRPVKIRNILIMLGVIFLVFKIPSWIGQKGVQAKYGNEFKAKIDEEIKYMACVKEGPFPFSSSSGRKSENSSYVTHTCEKCDVLYQAGMLSKNVIENPSAPGAQGSQVSGFDTRYELTELGNSVYTQGTRDGPYSKDPSRFCFGKARVKEITRTFGPVTLGGVNNIGIRYVAVLENPHPFLNEPQAKLLGIPLPKGSPQIYPEANVTAVFYNKNDFELDGSLTIGP